MSEDKDLAARVAAIEKTQFEILDLLTRTANPTYEQCITPLQLRTALQLAPSTFARWQAEGRFKRFELLPRLGRLHRYSRVEVEAYLKREKKS